MVIVEYFWVTGEASGDKHAARLINELNGLDPSLKHSGMCGDAMLAEGCEAVADISEISVMGIVEVVKHLNRILKLRDRLVDAILERKPKLVILVDLPDFNLPLMKALRKKAGRDLKIMYYVSPQIWAWRRGRAKTMAKHLDAMAVLFPFEKQFYEKYNLETVFFGHPLAGEVKPSATVDELRKEFGIQTDQPVVTIMPGSRSHEVERHLPVQLEAFKLFQKDHPEAAALVVKAGTAPDHLFSSIKQNDPAIKLVPNRTYDALAVSRAALVKSGTSTIETALMGVPFSVMYKVSPMTYRIGKWLIKGVKYIAMVNVLAGREIVPERIQEEATSSRLARDLEYLWAGKYREQVLDGLNEVKKLLGDEGATKRLAAWVHKRFGAEHE